jgi:hypothetical protein
VVVVGSESLGLEQRANGKRSAVSMRRLVFDRCIEDTHSKLVDAEIARVQVGGQTLGAVEILGRVGCVEERVVKLLACGAQKTGGWQHVLDGAALDLDPEER